VKDINFKRNDTESWETNTKGEIPHWLHYHSHFPPTLQRLWLYVEWDNKGSPCRYQYTKNTNRQMTWNQQASPLIIWKHCKKPRFWARSSPEPRMILKSIRHVFFDLFVQLALSFLVKFMSFPHCLSFS